METRSMCLSLLMLAASGCEAHIDVLPIVGPDVAGSPAPPPMRYVAGSPAPKPMPSIGGAPAPAPEPKPVVAGSPAPKPMPKPSIGGAPAPHPKPATPSDATFASYEVFPAKHELLLRGNAEADAEVILYRQGSSCGDELARQTASKSGELSIYVPDFRSDGQQAFEARVSKNGSTSACKAYPDFVLCATEINPAPEKPSELRAQRYHDQLTNNVKLTFKATDAIDRILVFNDTQCMGDAFIDDARVEVENGLHSKVFFVHDSTHVTVSVATERNGKRSPCSNAVEYFWQSGSPEPQEPAPEQEPVNPRIGAIVAEPGSIYGYQITGQASPGDGIKFFDSPDCHGNDLTRVVSKFKTGAFTAWIDVPPNYHLKALGFQVTHSDVVSCEELLNPIATLDDDILKFDDILRSRRDDASMDVTLSGTAHGRSIELFLGADCTGSAVASTEISSGLPFPWSLPSFRWSEEMSHAVSFKLTGTIAKAGTEEHCINKPGLLDLKITGSPLPDPEGKLLSEQGDMLEFSLGFASLPSDTNYYVNISYQYDCSDPIFRGAPKANYTTLLPKPVNALYGYTVSEDFRRTECIQLY